MAEKRYAVLIGNQDYENSDFNPLNSPHADVDALETVLNDETKGRFDSVEVLKEANRKDALKAIQGALKSKSKNDLLLIYFSGHGKTNDDGDLYLAASDTDGNDLEISGISAELISKWLGKGSADKTVLILDCCHAGAFAKGFKSGDELQTKTDAYSRAGGSYVLMACGAYELARDGADGALSFMTEHVVEGLSGSAEANDDGNITVHGLTDYLDKQMSVGKKQTFNQACHDQHGKIILSWAKAEVSVDQLEQSRAIVRDWAQKGLLSVYIEPEVLTCITEMKQGEADEADPRVDLITRLAQKQISSGDFNAKWVEARLTRTPPPEPTPQSEGVEKAVQATQAPAEDPEPETPKASGKETERAAKEVPAIESKPEAEGPTKAPDAVSVPAIETKAPKRVDPPAEEPLPTSEQREEMLEQMSADLAELNSKRLSRQVATRKAELLTQEKKNRGLELHNEESPVAATSNKTSGVERSHSDALVKKTARLKGEEDLASRRPSWKYVTGRMARTELPSKIASLTGQDRASELQTRPTKPGSDKSKATASAETAQRPQKKRQNSTKLAKPRTGLLGTETPSENSNIHDETVLVFKRILRAYGIPISSFAFLTLLIAFFS